MKNLLLAFGITLTLISPQAFAELAVTKSRERLAQPLEKNEARGQNKADDGYAVDRAGNKINWNKVKCKLDPNCTWLGSKF